MSVIEKFNCICQLGFLNFKYVDGMNTLSLNTVNTRGLLLSYNLEMGAVPEYVFQSPLHPQLAPTNVS
jgi:hypothetical protein